MYQYIPLRRCKSGAFRSDTLREGGGTRVVPRENLGGLCPVGRLLENEQGIKKFDMILKTHWPLLKAQ
jgi:hypothetical protein